MWHAMDGEQKEICTCLISEGFLRHKDAVTNTTLERIVGTNKQKPAFRLCGSACGYICGC